MRRLLLIGAISAAPGATAHAGGVADELSAGASLRASTTPSLSWIADRVSGTWDVSPEWQFRATFGATRPQVPDGQESSTIFNASGSADLALGAHWTLSFGGGWSPEATTHSSATIADRGLPATDQGRGRWSRSSPRRPRRCRSRCRSSTTPPGRAITRR